MPTTIIRNKVENNAISSVYNVTRNFNGIDNLNSEIRTANKLSRPYLQSYEVRKYHIL